MALQTSLPPDHLERYVRRQLDAHFPDDAAHDFSGLIVRTLPRIAHCFAAINHCAYGSTETPTFDHLHADQYTTFLYYASRVAALELRQPALATKLFLLNRAMHAFVCTYEVELPPIIYLNHVVGTVLGRGTYGNYLVVTQNVTVGHDRDLAPVIGERVTIYGGAMLVGDTCIADDVAIAPNSTLRNCSVPPSSIVAGCSPDLTIKPRSESSRRAFFRFPPRC
jgi:serine O-acetyltransferase